jgi:hypothetical protein
MRRSERKKKIFKKRDLREPQPQKKRGNILIAVRKGISRENAILSELIIRSPIIPGKKEAGKFKKSPNFKNPERLPVTGTPIKLSLL